MATKHYDPEQHLLFIAAPNDALPKDHLCYFVDEVVDKLDFSSLPDRSKTAGRPEYDPRLKTKVLIYGYASGVFSSRKLMAACREQLPFMFLTRGQYPDFRTLSLFRQDNLEFLREAFVQVVRIACQMGIAKLGVVAIDSSKVRANASQNKMMDKSRLVRLRKKIEEELCEAIAVDEREDARFGKEKTGCEMPQGCDKQSERLRQIDRALEELEQTGYKKVSLTDPECSQIRDHGQVRPRYSCQATVDVESKVIIAADVSRSPADSHELLGQLDQAESNTGKVPPKVLADNGYYVAEDVAELEERGVEGYIPDGEQAREAKLLWRGESADKSQFAKKNFVYDPEADTYTCPLEQTLVRKSSKDYPDPQYRCSHCGDCPRKPECAPKAVGRTITRNQHEASMERMRKRMDSEQGKNLYRERFNAVEPVFAWMKWATGFDRFLLRGKDGALKEYLLYCIGHNIKQIAKHLGNNDSPEANRTLADIMIKLLSFSKEIFGPFLNNIRSHLRFLNNHPSLRFAA